MHNVCMADVVTTDYAAVVAEVRAQMGREQIGNNQLAEMTGLTTSTMSRRMSGTQPFTVPELITVCRALGVTLTDLVADAKKHRPHPDSDGTGAAVARARFERATSGLCACPNGSGFFVGAATVNGSQCFTAELVREDLELAA